MYFLWVFCILWIWISDKYATDYNQRIYADELVELINPYWSENFYLNMWA